MKTTKMLNNQNVQRDWVIVDAKGKTFGRLVTEIATLLRGKHKPSFTPHIDCGDYVVVVNASSVKFTGNKVDTKNYYRHTGYFGGIKSDKLSDLLEKNPSKLFMLATRGMLPKSNLGKAMIKKLKVYAGEEHPHTAQVNAKGGN
ncbi:MAG: LSU ribosomal protein L13p (L13Ae) [uncultured Campylobacterales bacterium]|uniref:Large ribosomal subunit protein uL13 n=1 Tax=uncultured Campylobacterales bacterium TaxID=352960 RepID=A0A6S6TAI5_9BACT|nr:MAG: LSU ribosomal protein L13p (L13Ae) [uncultured Campylobacterales bacterium]